MSVDKTIEELNQAIVQLGNLVEHINKQLMGVSGRLNITLDTFDHSIMGIATDAGTMTHQVADTVSQVPNAWVFYTLFITLIAVLVLTALLIVISMVAKIQRLCRTLRGQPSRSSSPLPSFLESDSKQPLAVTSSVPLGRPSASGFEFASSHNYPSTQPYDAPSSSYRAAAGASIIEPTTYADEPRRFGAQPPQQAVGAGSYSQPQQQQQRQPQPSVTTGYATIAPKSAEITLQRPTLAKSIIQQQSSLPPLQPQPAAFAFGADALTTDAAQQQQAAGAAKPTAMFRRRQQMQQSQHHFIHHHASSTSSVHSQPGSISPHSTQP